MWKRGKTKIDIEMTRTKEEGGKEMGSEDKKGETVFVKGRSLKLAYFSLLTLSVNVLALPFSPYFPH